MALPIPLPPPVTIAAFPFSRMAMIVIAGERILNRCPHATEEAHYRVGRTPAERKISAAALFPEPMAP